MTDVRSSEWDVTSAGDLRQNSERNAQKALEDAGVQAKRENHREIFIRLERPLPEDVSEELYLQNQKWAKGGWQRLKPDKDFPRLRRLIVYNGGHKERRRHYPTYRAANTALHAALSTMADSFGEEIEELPN